MRRTRVEAEASVLKELQLCMLCAPHLEIGRGNSAGMLDTKAGGLIVAFKGGTWLPLGRDRSARPPPGRVRSGQRRRE